MEESKMKTSIKMYVKTIPLAKGKSFNTANVKLTDKWYTIKFGNITQVNLADYKQGYYDVSFDTELSSESYKNFTRKDGTAGKENILWINDPDIEVRRHIRDKEEQAKFDQKFDLPY